MGGWRLADVEERASAAPDTFAIPPRAERESLQPGDLAKLVFLDGEPVGGPFGGPGGERMWVLVGATEGGRYAGTLRNRPVVVRGLALDDEVRFGPEHVADFERPDA